MLTLSLTVELIASNAQALETSEGSDSSMNCLIFLPTLIPGTALMQCSTLLWNLPNYRYNNKKLQKSL